MGKPISCQGNGVSVAWELAAVWAVGRLNAEALLIEASARLLSCSFLDKGSVEWASSVTKACAIVQPVHSGAGAFHWLHVKIFLSLSFRFVKFFASSDPQLFSSM